MHASCSRPAEDDGGGAVEADPLELGVAVLAVGRDLAHADLVAHHLHRLDALAAAPAKWGKSAFTISARYCATKLIGTKIVLA